MKDDTKDLNYIPQCWLQPKRLGLSAHQLQEDKLFDLGDFTGRGDFLAPAQTYQLYSNFLRPNSHKEYQRRWQITERIAPPSPRQLRLLPPVLLDYHLNDSRGNDVPRLP